MGPRGQSVNGVAAAGTGICIATEMAQRDDAVGSGSVQPPSKRQRQTWQAADGEPEAATAPAPSEPPQTGRSPAAQAAGMQAPPATAEVWPNVCPLPLRYLHSRETTWQPGDAKPALNVRLDGRIVQSAAGGARIAYSHIVVLDDFIDEAVRTELLAFLTAPAGGAAGSSVSENTNVPAGSRQQAATEGQLAADAARLPSDRWERRTADQAGSTATWGVKDHVLRQLACSELPAVQEVHARLLRLYADVDIAHMPSDMIQTPAQPAVSSAAPDAVDGSGAGADCDQFVANAAVAGDTFAWHIDADPAGFPPSRWSDEFGDYCNGEPGRPLFVSLILYLDDEWQREWDAETLFLDSMSDVGIVVRPKRCRAILMDQDVLHRLSPPSPAAQRPRFSLVWKLVFVPRSSQQAACLARADWGVPTSFGSAARMDAVRRAVLSQQQ